MLKACYYSFIIFFYNIYLNNICNIYECLNMDIL